MKKLNYLFGAAVMAIAMTLASCSADDLPVLGIFDGDDLSTAVTNHTEIVNGVPTVKLPAGVTLTLKEALEVDAPLVISGDAASPAVITLGESSNFIVAKGITFENVVIDATALKNPMVQLKDLEGAIGAIENITFKGVTVKGLAYQLIYANKQSYLVDAIIVENSVLGINGSNKKTIFDFNGNGNTKLLSINNSTIYAVPTIGQNGGFFSSQSGKEVIDEAIGGNADNTATVSITNSTIYNVCNGKTVSTLRKNSQAYQKYIVKNNIIVNSGKSGQFLKGLNAGQAGKDNNWEVDGNCFNFDGAVVAEQKVGSADENIKNSIDAVINFADAENGDFTQAEAEAGDPRWVK